MPGEPFEGGPWPAHLHRNQPTLTAEEQARLLQSRAVVVGLGGLGGYLASLLVRAGVGDLVLVDGDCYEESNLNRQILATTACLGSSKARVTGDHCLSINPSAKVTALEKHFLPENGDEILDGAHVVMDGLDSVAVRKQLFTAAKRHGIPYIHGAVSGYVGQVSTFLPSSPLHLDHIYPADDLPASGPPSVLAPTVAIVAGIQVMEAIHLLCGHTPATAGALVFFDGTEISLHRIPLRD